MTAAPVGSLQFASICAALYFSQFSSRHTSVIVKVGFCHNNLVQCSENFKLTHIGIMLRHIFEILFLFVFRILTMTQPYCLISSVFVPQVY